MAGFGYRPLETPVVGDANLFLTRAGDRIATRLFTFHRGGRELALRPEFTSLAASHYVAGKHQGVRRWQFAGPVFEDAPQRGGEFQRFSVGAELFGLNGVAADAEIMALALTGLERLGIRNWRMVGGHIGLMRLMLARFDLDERTERFLINSLRVLRRRGAAQIMQQFEARLAGADGESPAPLQSLANADAGLSLTRLLRAAGDDSAMGGRSHQDIARRLLRKHQRLSERDQVAQALDALERWSRLSQPAAAAFDALGELTPPEAQPVLETWRQSVELLAGYGLPAERIVIQPDLARNWDYYSGMVFELHAADGQHVGGGGRYDELLAFLGAPAPTPAVGFTCWLDRLDLPRQAREPAGHFTVLLRDDNVAAATRLAQLLRANGLVAELVDDRQEETLVPDSAGAVAWRGAQFSVDGRERLLEALRDG